MISRFLQLQPARHGGRPLPHHHTSYPAMAFVFLVGAIALLGIGIQAQATVLSSSGGIDVSGIVNGPPPSQAPEIVDPASGTHVMSTPVALAGNCLSGLIVVIRRGGVDLGSALCQADGTFQLSVQLVGGQNNLVATQYDSLNQASPDSPATVIFYDVPPVKPTNPVNPINPQPPIKGNPLPPQPPQPPLPQPLLIQVPWNFIGLMAGRPVNLPVTISGGVPPNAINIDWGDGDSTLDNQPQNGRHIYPHTYLIPNAYEVVIKVTDSGGTKGYYQTVVLVAGVAPVYTTAGEVGSKLIFAWPLYAILGFMGLSFWMGERYDADRWRHRTHS